MSTWKQNKLITLVATTLLSSPLLAGPIVTQWGFSTDSKFSDATFNTGTGTTSTSDYELSWGNGSGDYTSPTANASNNRSALTVGSSLTNKTGGGPATGVINTTIGGTPDILAGQIGFGTTFTHWNNPISGNFATLTSAKVTDSLTLTPLLPSLGADISAPTLEFNFQFRETPNNGPCAGGTATPCGDLFGFAGTPNLNLLVPYDGNNYFASIFVLNEDLSASPIAYLNDGQCAALGFTTGTSGQRCQGFLTAESAWTTVQFGFAITTSPIEVPEPAPLALLGLGLVLAGLRRKSA